MQIPKKVHYCWFGKNPLPAMAVKCIESWKKYLPDYEIIEWNEDNFDVNIIPYNETSHIEYKKSSKETIMKFYDILKKNNIGVTIRREFGSKVNAACGQLRSHYEEV